METFADLKIVNPLGDHFKFKVRALEEGKCPGAFSQKFELKTEKPSCDCPRQIKTICPLPNNKEILKQEPQALSGNNPTEIKKEKAESRGSCLAIGLLFISLISLVYY